MPFYGLRGDKIFTWLGRSLGIKFYGYLLRKYLNCSPPFFISFVSSPTYINCNNLCCVLTFSLFSSHYCMFHITFLKYQYILIVIIYDITLWANYGVCDIIFKRFPLKEETLKILCMWNESVYIRVLRYLILWLATPVVRPFWILSYGSKPERK